MGANINDTLQEPYVLHAGIAAVRTHRTLICDCLGEIDAGILQAIDSGKNLGPDGAPQWLVARIRPAIIDMPRHDGGDNTVLVQRNPSIAERPFITVRTGNYVLAACFHPLDRTAACL